MLTILSNDFRKKKRLFQSICRFLNRSQLRGQLTEEAASRKRRLCRGGAEQWLSAYLSKQRRVPRSLVASAPRARSPRGRAVARAGSQREPRTRSCCGTRHSRLLNTPGRAAARGCGAPGCRAGTHGCQVKTWRYVCAPQACATAQWLRKDLG